MRDYVLWRNGSPLQNETFTPGTNTIEDYTAWRVNFNSGVASGSGAASGQEQPSQNQVRYCSVWSQA